MQPRTATIIGATGLIGEELLHLLGNDPYYDRVRVLARRPLSFDNPRIEAKLINFQDQESFKIGIDGSDAVFCAVGTTQKKVKGDMVAYRQVDYDIPVKAAQFCAETGCNNFLVVSSVGANSNSRNFYLKLKGEMEEGVSSKNVKSVSIFRPSMLLGKRKESRPGEKIGQVLMPAISFLLPGNYKPVEGRIVAAAMVAAAKEGKPGTTVYHYKDIMQLATAGLRQG